MEIFGDLERLIDDIYPYRWLVVVPASLAGLLLATAAFHYGWHLAIMRHKLRTALVAVPLLVVAIPVSYYLLSPLWTRTTIYEESPLAAAQIAVAGVPAPTSTPTVATTDEMAATEASTVTSQLTPPSAPESPSAAIEPTPTGIPDPRPTNEPEPEPTTEPTPEPTLEPVIEPTIEPVIEPTPEPEPEPTIEPVPAAFTPRLVSSGSLSGAGDFHFAAGTALLIETEPGVYVLRLEEFSVRNGPDLFVYLAASADFLDDASINLSELRATDGSINYDVPPGTDISQFQGVVIWCRAFAVFFGSAPLLAS